MINNALFVNSNSINFKVKTVIDIPTTLAYRYSFPDLKGYKNIIIIFNTIYRQRSDSYLQSCMFINNELKYFSTVQYGADVIYYGKDTSGNAYDISWDMNTGFISLTSSNFSFKISISYATTANLYGW